MDVYNSYLLALVAHHFIILSTLTSKSLLFSKSPSKHHTMGPFLRYLAAGTPVSGDFRRLPLTRAPTVAPAGSVAAWVQGAVYGAPATGFSVLQSAGAKSAWAFL